MKSGWNVNRAMSCAGLTVALAVCGTTASAQGFPNKPLRVIIPAAAGTGSDVIVRMVAGKLGERLKQQVVAENRTGAGAIVGVNYLKNATPDGYTIGVIQSANTIQPWLIKELPFDVRKDFAPLMLIYTVPLVMVVPANSPARNVAEFVAYAKANPGKVFYGTTGIGATGHLSAELFKQLAGFDMTVVPYKGTPEMISSLMGGNVAMYFDAYAASKGLVDAGRTRLLAVTSRQRMNAAPNVPSFSETYPGFEVIGWVGLAAPLGTPKEIHDRLASELMAVMRVPEFRKQLQDSAAEPSGIGPAEFSVLISADTQKWGKVVELAGLKKE